ncbi:MAG: tetratricopeptide repeat protein [Bacteroidia bacterium]|nr:tetratricopeptide repeat protein [Bacteroidia bacterium]
MLYKVKAHIFFGLLLLAVFSFTGACKSKNKTVSARNIQPAGNTAPTDGQKEATFGYMYINGCTERMKGNLQQALKIFEECKKWDAKNPAVNYELGTIYKMLGNNEMALANAKVCAAADQKNEWYQLLLVECYNSLRQYNQAIKVRENLVKNFPDKSDFKEDLAIEYALTGQYERSLKIYEELEKNHGINEQLILNKVKLLKSQRRYNDAEAELLRLSASDKYDARYYSYLAEFYLEQNQPDKAKSVYDKILEIDPNNPSVNLALHDYYNAKGQEEEAFRYLKKAYTNPDLDLNTKSDILAQFYKNAEQGSADAAGKGAELAKIMLELHPKSPEANGIYADFLRLDRKTKEAAKYYYLAAVNEKRNFRVWRNLLYAENELARFDSLAKHSEACYELFPTLPEAYLFNGLANIQLKEYQKAVFSLKQGFDYVVDNKAFALDFLRAMGDAYNYLKDYPKSDKAFNDALKIDADNTYVLNNYAYFLSLRNENLDVAEKYSKRANDLKPNNRSYMDTYGWILYMQKKYAEAEIWLSKAAAMSANDATVLEHYGDALFRVNKTNEALQQWNLAKQAGGNSESLLKKIKEKKLND